jgi:phenylacetate-CoA ligase
MQKAFSTHIGSPAFYYQKHLKNKLSQNCFSLLQDMRRREFWSAEQLREYQFNRLKKLLIHAGTQVPYYRDLFAKCGFDPYSFQDLQELASLPPLTKEIIKEQGHRLHSQDAKQRGMYENSTSGSTGSPSVFYQDQNYQDYQRAATWLSDMAAGWNMGDSIARLWGGHQDVQSNIKTSMQRFENWLLNQHWYDAYNITPETMLQYHHQLSRKRHDILIAYASSAYLYAQFLESRDIKPDYPLKGFISSAEVLHAYMRETIERVFNTKIFDRYGSRDAGLVGYECDQHQGLHVNSQNLYLECDRTEHGQPGLALVTLFENYAMPFIRYQIGDMLVMSEQTCTCGRGAPLIERIMGRTQDFITLRSGKRFVGEYITQFFRGEVSIKNFQFVQENLEEFELYIVKGENYQDTLLEKIQRSINEMFGQECHIKNIFVDELPPNPSGKYRTVISKVPLRFG